MKNKIIKILNDTIDNERAGMDGEIILPDLINLEEAAIKIINMQKKEVKELLHYRDYTIGLWCTDKPELIKDKKLFFKLK